MNRHRVKLSCCVAGTCTYGGPDPIRTVKDVGIIVGEELDTMTAVFGDIAWEVDSRGMVGTFTCDGQLYEIRVGKCSPELREELGYPEDK